MAQTGKSITDYKTTLASTNTISTEEIVATSPGRMKLWFGTYLPIFAVPAWSKEIAIRIPHPLLLGSCAHQEQAAAGGASSCSREIYELRPLQANHPKKEQQLGKSLVPKTAALVYGLPINC